MIPSGNPFAFPGMPGAAPSFDPGAANPVMQSLDMMRQVWGNLGSMASAAPGGNVPGLDELDKRITDLRAIENWLNLNLTMLRGTIQGLEVQRATISTLRNFAQNVSSAYQAHTPSGASDTDASDLPPPSPLEIVLGLRKAPGAAADASPFGFSTNATPPASPPTPAAAAPAAQPTGWPHMPAHMPPSMPASMQPPAPQPSPQAAAPAQPPSPPAPPAADAPSADGSTAAAPGSPQANAWWSMLQDQFNKITTAASQAVPAVPAMPQIPQMPTMPHMDLAKAAAAAARTVFEPSRAPDAPAPKAAPAERTSPPARKTSSGRNGAASKPSSSKSPASKSPASKSPARKAAGKTAAKRAPAASKAPAKKAPAPGARGKA
jgi:hypothetical protein